MPLQIKQPTANDEVLWKKLTHTHIHTCLLGQIDARKCDGRVMQLRKFSLISRRSTNILQYRSRFEARGLLNTGELNV